MQNMHWKFKKKINCNEINCQEATINCFSFYSGVCAGVWAWVCRHVGVCGWGCVCLVAYMAEMSMSLKCSSQPSWAAASLNSSVIWISPKSRLNSAGKVTIQNLHVHIHISRC